MPDKARALVVETTRGGLVESRHQVHAVIADGDGAIVAAHGEVELPIFPRSSINALQALPLVESGAADKFGFEPKHLALACASHNGEVMHTQAASQMLKLAGLEPACLECGAQMPSRTLDRIALAKNGKTPGALHNNCSGKHAGFVAFAAHQGIATNGYIGIEHDVQKTIAGTLEQIIAEPHKIENHGIDGCSIPTYQVPLASLAKAFAKFATGANQAPERAKAMARLREACFAHPEMVGGTERACTIIMAALKDRAFVKIGAEGVYTAALPELGYGIALKCADGSMRAAEATIAHLLKTLLEKTPARLSDKERDALEKLPGHILTNFNKITVGHVRVAQSDG